MAELRRETNDRRSWSAQPPPWVERAAGPSCPAARRADFLAEGAETRRSVAVLARTGSWPCATAQRLRSAQESLGRAAQGNGRAARSTQRGGYALTFPGCSF